MSENKSMTWDLSDLFLGMDDPRIEATLDSQLKRAGDFAARYRGKIDNPDLDAAMLREAIEQYESILQEADKPLEFASLLFASDTSDPARGAFLQKMRERMTEISVRLMSFELELMALPEDHASRLTHEPSLEKYRHYVWALRLFRDYRLTEPEETVIEEKANTGRRAFTRLFDQVVSDIPFKVERDGIVQTITMPEVLALIRDPDREVRKKAAASLTEGLVSNGLVLTYIFNTLLQDKATEDRLRDYSFPEQSRHLANELDPDTVELVAKTSVDHYPIVARYYDLKREMLGYDKLMHYDRYAPLFESRETVSFDQAKDMVLSAFGEFSPVIGDTAAKFFDNRWIDAEIRKGKRGGAFCSYVTPDLHPYVFVNYLNRMDDVMTLGHELGHGVHSYLARDKGYLNFASVLPLAELASTFGEMLVFEKLQDSGDLESRLALYAEKIEGAFATIFRQAAMYRFEQQIHKMRREQGELTVEQFSEIWQAQQQAMFGTSVELGDEHRFWWMYVSHFIGSPFYVYAYTFGELLVMALYAIYKEQGDEFPPKYIGLLKTGGSKAPAEMLGGIGIDVHDPSFWKGGVQVLSGFIDRFEELYKEWKESR